MAFMVPEIIYDTFYHVENTHGEGTLVPGDLVGSKPKKSDFKDYIEGTPASFKKQKGWFAHLTAHGYMDQTEWSGPFKTEAEAMEWIKEFYEVDEEGESLYDDTGLEEENGKLPPLGEVRGKATRIEIIVGNVGTVFNEYAVYSSKVAKKAEEAYEMYINRSVNGIGRSAGEDVTMLVDGEVYKEYRGSSTEGLLRGKKKS